MQDEFGLLKRIPLTTVPQKLKEAEVPRQVGFADTTEHPEEGLEQGKQTLRPILVNLPAYIFLLRVIDERMEASLQRPIAAGRIGIQATARLNGEIGRLLHGLDGKIPDGLHNDGTLAADPRDDCGPVFVVMTPARLALFATAACPASQVSFPSMFRLTLVASGVIEFIRFDSPRQLALRLIG
jgi:hypothetical protein